MRLGTLDKTNDNQHNNKYNTHNGHNMHGNMQNRHENDPFLFSNEITFYLFSGHLKRISFSVFYTGLETG